MPLAGVAKQVDALLVERTSFGSSVYAGREIVWVRAPPPAPEDLLREFGESGGKTTYV